MTTLLHIAASPRGAASESRAIATTFLDAYRDTHPDDEILEWDLWDGTLPEFGPAAAAAKMAVFAGADPQGDEARAWRRSTRSAASTPPTATCSASRCGTPACPTSSSS
jgi:FMN-dependent NADH-azoreductase